MSVSDAYIFHIVLTTIVMTVGTAYAWKRNWLRFYSPIFMFLISFTLMYLLNPLGLLIVGGFSNYEHWFAKLNYSYASLVVYSSVVTNLGIVALIMGYSVAPRKRFSFPMFDLKEYPFIVAIVFVPFLLLGFYSQIYYHGTGFMSTREWGGVTTTLGYILTGDTSGYTLMAHYFIQPIALMLLLWRRTRRLGVAIFLAYLYFRLQSIWSRAAIITIILSAICIYLRSRKLRWPSAKLTGLAVIFALLLVARGHQAIKDIGILQLYKSTELGRSLPHFFASTNFDQFEASIYTIGLTEDIFEQTKSYDWGRSLLTMPVRLLPRRIFPWKDNVRAWLGGRTHELYTERMFLIHGNNVGIIAGFYRYAGLLSIVVFMFVVGLFFRRIYKALQTHTPDYLRVAGSMAVGAIIMETRGELEWYLVTMLFLLLPLISAVSVCAFHRAMGKAIGVRAGVYSSTSIPKRVLARTEGVVHQQEGIRNETIGKSK